MSDEFWETANKPWLDDAVARGDNFRFVSDPKDPRATHYYDDDGAPIMHNGEHVKSIFGREVDYLEANGYTFQPDGTAVKGT
ncbi:hypothetical protein [Sorangium sp. So ce381]|uniref:hypothetical protein n=1 Tax=Sorangium sp. So ce381 TaxID=3133307 RepID=UPI003F5B86DD